MILRTSPIAMTGFLILLATMVPASAAGPQPKASDNDAAQLKAVQDERIKVLNQLVVVLTAHYKAGTCDVARVFAAENDLCNALLDSTDKPEKRVALLTKEVDKAKGLIKITEARFDTGIATQADVLQAKSLYLGLKIKLLRERNKKKPG